MARTLVDAVRIAVPLRYALAANPDLTAMEVLELASGGFKHITDDQLRKRLQHLCEPVEVEDE